MRVGLNATCFNDRPSGAKQRFVGIYGELIRRCADIQFFIYEPADCRVAGWFDGAPNVAARRTPIPSAGRVQRIWKGLGCWPGMFAEDRLDIFENFHLPMVRARNAANLLTMHDLRDGLPGSPFVKRIAYLNILRRALRSADQIIAVSNAIKAQLLSIVPESKVTTVYNGIDSAGFASVGERAAEATRRKYALSGQFILAVGHLERRKNYRRLVAAIARLRDQGLPSTLLIVGNDGGDGPAIGAEVDRLGLAGRVRILGGISDAELAEIYSLCSLVVFPSCYEGFGIPLLEAMAARRPLVLSDIPVFRELTEGQGTYFPPKRPDIMADVLASMMADPERQRRSIDYGMARVRDFAFPKLAAQVEQLYRIAARSRGA
ncbi:MAG TPA: glycosyltransferase family 1 protein [Allosphingosinicella sp.]|nr:glycosyltransferase family 1 protein [Allosphingosinicella sp.]